MERIQIHMSLEESNDNTMIKGIPVQEILNFLHSIDNGSFEKITLLYRHHKNLLYIIEEHGIRFPEYGHFITEITESKYAGLFNFSCDI